MTRPMLRIAPSARPTGVRARRVTESGNACQTGPVIWQQRMALPDPRHNDAHGRRSSLLPAAAVTSLIVSVMV